MLQATPVSLSVALFFQVLVLKLEKEREDAKAKALSLEGQLHEHDEVVQG